jgi:S-DNA-T family DNA segregation ATPase FtsK/SpoIIIE
MLSRYKTLNANGVRDLKSYNSLCEGNDELTKMPQIVIFIDELADLMTAAPAEVEDSIQRIAQMGRAAGMHLVIATQRPSVDVITGVIKANIPSRIALTVKSQIDSRTMIDQAGAEKLMGYGDMLYYPVGVPKPLRVQGAFIADEEIDNIVAFLKANGEAMYDDDVQQEIDRQAAAEKKKGGAEEKTGSELDKNDDLLMRAIELFVSAPEKASISALQRHLGLGFAKAGRLMDTLEEKGVVGPTEGSKPRKVLITKQQWYEMNAMSSDVTGSTDAAPDFTEADEM